MAIMVTLHPRNPDHFTDTLFTISLEFGLFGVTGRVISVPDSCRREEKIFVIGFSYSRSATPR